MSNFKLGVFNSFLISTMDLIKLESNSSLSNRVSLVLNLFPRSSLY